MLMRGGQPAKVIDYTAWGESYAPGEAPEGWAAVEQANHGEGKTWRRGVRPACRFNPTAFSGRVGVIVDWEYGLPTPGAWGGLLPQYAGRPFVIAHGVNPAVSYSLPETLFEREFRAASDMLNNNAASMSLDTYRSPIENATAWGYRRDWRLSVLRWFQRTTDRPAYQVVTPCLSRASYADGSVRDDAELQSIAGTIDTSLCVVIHAGAANAAVREVMDRAVMKLAAMIDRRLAG